MKRRIVCLLLALLLLAAVLPLPTASAERAQVTLTDLRAKFPSGTYWNHPGGYNSPNNYTYSPCGHAHGSCDYYGGCGCNSFGGAIQCLGYAYKLSYDYYGVSAKYWSKTYSLDSVKPGDVLRYRNDSHSVFVTDVTDTTITYTDCNMDRHCGIRWGVTVSRAAIAAMLTSVSVAPYAAVWGLPPTAPSFQDVRSIYRQHDTVNFRWTPAEDNESYRLTVLLNGEELFSRNLSSSLAFALRLDHAGNYTAKLYGTNSYGESEETVCEFSVLARKLPESGWVSAADSPLWVQHGLEFLHTGAEGDDTAPDSALSLNQATLATLLWCAAGQPEVRAKRTAAQTQWYATAALWAEESGLWGETAFDPDVVVTREQLALVLFRYAEASGAASSKRADLTSYPDAANVDETTLEAMQWAVAAGLLAGSGTGGIVYLAPKDAITGEDTALVLARYLQSTELIQKNNQHLTMEQ